MGVQLLQGDHGSFFLASAITKSMPETFKYKAHGGQKENTETHSMHPQRRFYFLTVPTVELVPRNKGEILYFICSWFQ